MSVKYHGKYCGPGWSAGKYQPSVKSRVPPDDEFDATCKVHDGAYAYPTNSQARSKADDEFYKQNIGGGPKRAIAALAVKAASKIMRAQERNPEGIRFRGTTKPSRRRKSAKSRARAQLDQRKRLTQNGQLINSITNNKLIERNPSPTMTRNNNNKYKANNAKTKAAVAVSKTVRIAKPKFKSASDGLATITHREYIGPVYASTTGSYQSINCNPGLDASFPWLAAVANGYERYKFLKLEYTYVSAAATSERGRVGLAYQYDPTAANPKSRSDFFSIVPNVEEAPWEDMVLRVKPVSELRYIRSGALSTGTTNTYDCGKVQILTAMNADSTTQLGELFVEYVVQLQNPQFNQSPIAGSLSINSETAAAPFGTSITTVSGTPPFIWNSGTTLRMNTSSPMMIRISFAGTGLNQPDPTLTLGSGSNGTISTITNLVNGTSTVQTLVCLIAYTQPDDLLTIAASESTTITQTVAYTARYVEF